MPTPEQIAEIRERLTDYRNGNDVANPYPRKAPADVAALLDHCERYAALTPEVVGTLCEACDEAMMAATEEADNAYHRQARRNNALMRHDQFADARAVLESLK